MFFFSFCFLKQFSDDTWEEAALLQYVCWSRRYRKSWKVFIYIFLTRFVLCLIWRGSSVLWICKPLHPLFSLLIFFSFLEKYSWKASACYPSSLGWKGFLITHCYFFSMQFYFDQKYAAVVLPCGALLWVAWACTPCWGNRGREDYCLSAYKCLFAVEVTHPELSSIYRNIWFYWGW